MAEKNPGTGRALSRVELEQEVVKMALGDEGFRRRLLADPKQALESAFGLVLGPGMEVEVLQETASKFYLVLPLGSDELSDEELDKVSAGIGSSSFQQIQTSLTSLMSSSTLGGRRGDV
jgi:hypothetical protein